MPAKAEGGSRNSRIVPQMMPVTPMHAAATQITPGIGTSPQSVAPSVAPKTASGTQTPIKVQGRAGVDSDSWFAATSGNGKPSSIAFIRSVCTS